MNPRSHFLMVMLLICFYLKTEAQHCPEYRIPDPTLESSVVGKRIQLKNIKMVNSGHLEYSPTVFDNGIVFTSTRGVDNPDYTNDGIINIRKYCDLFYSERKKSGEYTLPVPLKGFENGKLHDSNATFNNTGDVMFFSRNSSTNRQDDHIKDLKIFQSVKEDGKWQEAIEFPHNEKYTSCHPSLSADGKRLYFASNRPGGFGGLDIYVSKFEDGAFQSPINLGPFVNSAGNEFFPCIAYNDVLYFSSEGRADGLGGIDIYMVIKADKKDEHTWRLIQNMGEPFNSPSDDFGFVMNTSGLNGYLTTNRGGGLGKDDIYEWKIKVIDQANSTFPSFEDYFVIQNEEETDRSER